MWRWLVVVSLVACATTPPPRPHCFVTVREPTSVMSNGVNTVMYKQRTYRRAGRCADGKDVNQVTCLDQDDEADRSHDDPPDLFWLELAAALITAPFVIFLVASK